MSYCQDLAMYDTVLMYNDEYTRYDYNGYSTFGWAVVRSNGKYGIVNNIGDTVLPFEYSSISYASDGAWRSEYIGGAYVKVKYWTTSQGMIFLEKDDKWGWIDSTANMIVEPQYDWLGHSIFTNEFTSAGHIIYRVDSIGEDHRYGILNRSGEVVVDSLAFLTSKTTCDKYTHMMMDDKHMVVAWDSVAVPWVDGAISPIEDDSTVIGYRLPGDRSAYLADGYRDYDYVYGYTSGMRRVGVDGKYGFVDEDWNIIIPLVYDTYNIYAYRPKSECTSGGTLAQYGGNWDIYDIDGNVIPNCQFDDVLHAYNWDMDCSESNLIVIRSGWNYGMVNMNCEIIIDTICEQMDNSRRVEEDIPLFWSLYEGCIPVKIDGLWGIMDTTGNFVVEPTYHDFGYERAGPDFSDGYSVFSTHGKDFGLIGIDGSIKIPEGKYDVLIDGQGDRYAAKLNGKWGVIDSDENIIMPFEYKKIEVESSLYRIRPYNYPFIYYFSVKTKDGWVKYDHWGGKIDDLEWVELSER